MAIKAIMCDVDGTLLNSQGVVSPYTIEQIKRIKAQGVLFGLATGRDVHSVKNQLERWGIGGLVDAIVGTGGAEIADFQLNVEKSSFPLDGDVIRQVIRHYEDLDVNFAIPWQGELYAPKDDRLIQRLSRVDHIPYH
ncbi:MAG: HAD family hydrolase, partial [Holdemania filiformis]